MDDNAQLFIITGATGFIGGHVLTELLITGHSVIAITRDASGPNLKKHQNLKWITWHEFNCSRDSLNEKIACVIHLATDYGRNGAASSEISYSNYQRPKDLFDTAISMGAKKIIFADTFYGKPQFEYPHLDAYTRSKRKLLEWCISKSTDCGTRFLNVRFEHVFGPNDNKDKFIPQIIHKLVNLEFPIELTDGNQKRDFVYIDDLVAALIILIKTSTIKRFEEYEVGSGYSVSVQTMVRMLAKIYGKDSSILRFGAIKTRPKEIMESCANIKPLCRLGWRPTWNLENALLDLKMRQDEDSQLKINNNEG